MRSRFLLPQNWILGRGRIARSGTAIAERLDSLLHWQSSSSQLILIPHYSQFSSISRPTQIKIGTEKDKDENKGKDKDKDESEERIQKKSKERVRKAIAAR